MKLIPLGHNRFAMISDCDFKLVSKHTWCALIQPQSKNIYAITNAIINGKHTTLRMHRLIMGAKKGEEIDHIDGNGLNNQRNNLRFCTHQENNCNNRKAIGKTSIYKGVFLKREKKRRTCWCAHIMMHGKTIFIGYFGTEEKAAIAYNEKAILYHGNFAKLNIIK